MKQTDRVEIPTLTNYFLTSSGNIRVVPRLTEPRRLTPRSITQVMHDLGRQRRAVGLKIQQTLPGLWRLDNSGEGLSLFDFHRLYEAVQDEPWYLIESEASPGVLARNERHPDLILEASHKLPTVVAGRILWSALQARYA
jgi:hypothetical protein